MKTQPQDNVHVAPIRISTRSVELLEAKPVEALHVLTAKYGSRLARQGHVLPAFRNFAAWKNGDKTVCVLESSICYVLMVTKTYAPCPPTCSQQAPPSVGTPFRHLCMKLHHVCVHLLWTKFRHVQTLLI